MIVKPIKILYAHKDLKIYIFQEQYTQFYGYEISHPEIRRIIEEKFGFETIEDATNEALEMCKRINVTVEKEKEK